MTLMKSRVCFKNLKNVSATECSYLTLKSIKLLELTVAVVLERRWSINKMLASILDLTRVFQIKDSVYDTDWWHAIYKDSYQEGNASSQNIRNGFYR